MAIAEDRKGKAYESVITKVVVISSNGPYSNRSPKAKAQDEKNERHAEITVGTNGKCQ